MARKNPIQWLKGPDPTVTLVPFQQWNHSPGMGGEGMKKSAIAALVLCAGLVGSIPVQAEQRARSWELSPFIGVYKGSSRLDNAVNPLYGLRVGYNINRWWAVELAYSGSDGFDMEYEVGSKLVGGSSGLGEGIWTQIGVEGFAVTDVQMLDLNVLISTRPVKRRTTFYVTAGLGQAKFSSIQTQAQLDAAFPLGPNPLFDTFDFNGNGDTNDLVDEYTSRTSDTVFDDPNDPLIPTAGDCTDANYMWEGQPAGQSGDGCYDFNSPAPARSFVATGESLPTANSSQWNMGGGMRTQLTNTMALRLDLRQNFGGLGYTMLMFSAGLSFRFGGEPPIDNDGDGVPAFRDICPDTPNGATVDAKGCPGDLDGDEVLNGLDLCPNTPVGWPVDDDGCPTDADGDGVPDGRDTCDDTPLGAVVDHDGCPVDSDGDGVPDGLDDCVTTPEGAVVDEKGCAIDSDEDGVPDGLDKCDDTPAGLPVDADGCPIDSDGDGLKDDVDACPAFAGPGGVDEEGCPKMRLDKTARISMPQVSFAFGSAVITDGGKEELVTLISALNFYDDLTFEIEGHTDDVGSERDNFLISVERAKAVENYLRDQGIDPARMSVRGYGEIRPIGDNTTSEGRDRNRRIEILVTGVMEVPEEEAAPGDAAGVGEDASAGGESQAGDSE
jgi:outer membrane protein OmpA-like peptidoglycan-associated protein